MAAPAFANDGVSLLTATGVDQVENATVVEAKTNDGKYVDPDAAATFTWDNKPHYVIPTKITNPEVEDWSPAGESVDEDNVFYVKVVSTSSPTSVKLDGVDVGVGRGAASRPLPARTTPSSRPTATTPSPATTRGSSSRSSTARPRAPMCARAKTPTTRPLSTPAR